MDVDILSNLATEITYKFMNIASTTLKEALMGPIYTTTLFFLSPTAL